MCVNDERAQICPLVLMLDLSRSRAAKARRVASANTAARLIIQSSGKALGISEPIIHSNTAVAGFIQPLLEFDQICQKLLLDCPFGFGANWHFCVWTTVALRRPVFFCFFPKILFLSAGKFGQTQLQ